MKKVAMLTVILAASVVIAGAARQPERAKDPESPAAQTAPIPDMEVMAPPSRRHKWLDQFVGTWTVESEMVSEGEPAMKSVGTDTVRSLGGRWIVCDLRSEVPGMGAMSAVLTLGYNSQTGKYQGTWVDSVTDLLWVYEGDLDPAGKVLTLEAEGPNLMDPAKGDTRYRDVIEFKNADHRTLTSFALVDGEWVQFMTANYRKKE